MESMECAQKRYKGDKSFIAAPKVDLVKNHSDAAEEEVVDLIEVGKEKWRIPKNSIRRIG